jgi:hypothetical protein
MQSKKTNNNNTDKLNNQRNIHRINKLETRLLKEKCNKKRYLKNQIF